MVNYEWELKYYRGALIAVSSKCIAYALKGTYSIIIPILIIIIVGFIHCIEISVYLLFLMPANVSDRSSRICCKALEP